LDTTKNRYSFLKSSKKSYKTQNTYIGERRASFVGEVLLFAISLCVGPFACTIVGANDDSMPSTPVR
jgi:hypothetical protein